MRDLLFAECDDTFIRVLEPSDHAKDGCLTGARRTKESDELTGFDIESDPCNRGDRTEGLAKVSNLNQRHLCAPDQLMKGNNRGRLGQNE